MIRMANQIARNLAVHGEERAVAATAQHITLFWDPRMKAEAQRLLDEPDCGLSPVARAAIERLSARAA